jgi:hypothetical protein
MPPVSQTRFVVFKASPKVKAVAANGYANWRARTKDVNLIFMLLLGANVFVSSLAATPKAAPGYKENTLPE